MEKFGMQDWKGLKIPMPTNGQLDTEKMVNIFIRRYIAPSMVCFFNYVHLGQILC